jgi:hypothetical protein
MNRKLALRVLAAMTLLPAGIAYAACDVPGSVRIDPYDDANLGIATDVPQWLGLVDSTTTVKLPVGSLASLDVGKVESCYDSGADEFEYRLTVKNAARLAPWAQWAVLANSFYRTSAYVEAVSGPGMAITGYRLMRFSAIGPGVPLTPHCLGPIAGRLEGNTFVMRVSRQALATAVFADDPSSALMYISFFTGVHPAPRLDNACGLPEITADR